MSSPRKRLQDTNDAAAEDSDNDTLDDIDNRGSDHSGQSGDNSFSDAQDQHHSQPSSDLARQRSLSEEDEGPLQIGIPIKEKEKPVTWMSLPQKDQLAILTMARLSEPLVQSSLRVSKARIFLDWKI